MHPKRPARAGEDRAERADDRRSRATSAFGRDATAFRGASDGWPRSEDARQMRQSRGEGSGSGMRQPANCGAKDRWDADDRPRARRRGHVASSRAESADRGGYVRGERVFETGFEDEEENPFTKTGSKSLNSLLVIDLGSNKSDLQKAEKASTRPRVNDYLRSQSTVSKLRVNPAKSLSDLISLFDENEYSDRPSSSRSGRKEASERTSLYYCYLDNKAHNARKSTPNLSREDPSEPIRAAPRLTYRSSIRIQVASEATGNKMASTAKGGAKFLGPNTHAQSVAGRSAHARRAGSVDRKASTSSMASNASVASGVNNGSVSNLSVASSSVKVKKESIGVMHRAIVKEQFR